MSTDSIVVGRPRLTSGDDTTTLTWTIDGHDVSMWSSDADLRDLQDVVAAPFAVAGAHLGRPVIIEGEMSRRLHRGLGRLAKVHRRWFDSHRLDLTTDRLVRRPATGGATALAFTGGIDSFHALLTRRSTPDTLLFVNGFDIEIGDTTRFEHAERGLRAVAAAVGAEPVVVHTDLRRHPTFASVDWSRTHGAALAGVAHSLPGHERLRIASSWALSNPEPWGSHFATDHLLASESLRVEHADALVNRYEKTVRIAHEPLAHEHLRVCWENRAPVGNCGRCSKCAVTQLCFHHLGTLEEFETFPPIDDIVTLAEVDDIVRFRYVVQSILDDGLEERLARPIHQRLAATDSSDPRLTPVARQLYDRALLAVHNR